MGYFSDLRIPDILTHKYIYGNNHILFLDDFSSRPNNKLHQQPRLLKYVCAPGVAIVGPYKSYGYGTGIGYYYLWGTSMAAPHVSGIAALVAQDFPDITPYEMHKILKNAAHGNPLPADGTLANNPWGMQYYEWTGKDYGAGWLQATKAVFVASATYMGLM